MHSLDLESGYKNIELRKTEFVARAQIYRSG